MPEIDPDATPVSADDLARDARAAGADPDAPPLVEAGDAESDPADRVEADITLLPPG